MTNNPIRDRQRAPRGHPDPPTPATLEVLLVDYGVNEGHGFQALTSEDIVIYNLGDGTPTRYYATDDKRGVRRGVRLEFVKDSASHGRFCWCG